MAARHWDPRALGLPPQHRTQVGRRHMLGPQPPAIHRSFSVPPARLCSLHTPAQCQAWAEEARIGRSLVRGFWEGDKDPALAVAMAPLYVTSFVL